MKKCILFGLTLIISFMCTLPAAADKLNDAQQQKSYLEDKASSLQKSKSEQQKILNKVQSSTKNIISQQQQEKERYNELSSQIDALNKEIGDLDKAVKESEDNYNKQKELFKVRLKVMYENSDNSYIKAIVESSNIIDMFSKLKYISLISKRDNELADDLESAKKDVEYKRSMKQNESYKKLKELSVKKTALNNLQISRAANDKAEKEIKAKMDLLDSQIDEANRQAEEIAAQIRNLTKNSGKYTGGSMLWPVPSCGQISSPFGWRFHPILKQNKYHSGIDIPGGMGASIVAANSGTVVLAGWVSGYGNTVVIDHGGGISTLYGHSSKLLVSSGDKVEAGQVIAKVGSTGQSTGPHLHFEVIKNGTQVDPTGYVSP